MAMVGWLLMILASIFTKDTADTFKEVVLLGAVVSSSSALVVVPISRWFNNKLAKIVNPITAQLAELAKITAAIEKKQIEQDVKLDVALEALEQVLPNHGSTMNDKITQILAFITK